SELYIPIKIVKKFYQIISLPQRRHGQISIVFRPSNNLLLIITLINSDIPHAAHPNWKQITRKKVILNGKTGVMKNKQKRPCMS
ncbi:MAG: hypothetical protein ABTQ25_07110, partial [Nitrosomonas ureae]